MRLLRRVLNDAVRKGSNHFVKHAELAKCAS